MVQVLDSTLNIKVLDSGMKSNMYLKLQSLLCEALLLTCCHSLYALSLATFPTLHPHRIPHLPYRIVVSTPVGKTSSRSIT